MFVRKRMGDALYAWRTSQALINDGQRMTQGYESGHWLQATLPSLDARGVARVPSSLARVPSLHHLPAFKRAYPLSTLSPSLPVPFESAPTLGDCTDGTVAGSEAASEDGSERGSQGSSGSTDVSQMAALTASLERRPGPATFPLDTSSSLTSSLVSAWVQEAGANEVRAMVVSSGLPGPHFVNLVEAHESEVQANSRRLLQAQSDSLLPLFPTGSEHTHSKHARRFILTCLSTDSTFLDMPLHWVPAEVPVDFPSLTRAESAVDELERRVMHIVHEFLLAHRRTSG